MLSNRFIRVLALLCLANLAGAARAAAVDSTFGTGGVVTSEFGARSFASKIALQADGKIVVAGEREPSAATSYPASEFLVARYLPSGTVDAGFAGGYASVRIENPAPRASAGGLVIRPDGRIVVVGTSWYVPGMLGVFRAVALAFTTHGARDSSWGSGGVALPSNVDYYSAIALQPDGKVVAGGPGFILDRYNDNGTLDAGFAAGTGRLQTNPDNKDFALQPDGNFLVAGWNSNTFTAHRYAPSGTLISTATGQSAIAGGNHMAMALQADGKVLMASAASGTLGLLARFNPSGSPDSGFGTAGIVTTSTPLVGITLQPDGKIVGIASNWELVRLNTDGSADTSFGRNGRFAVAMPPGSSSRALAVQPDGKILATGYSGWTSPTATAKVALARVDPTVPSLSLSVAPASLEFAGQSRGTTSPSQQVVFTNTGPTALVVSGVSTTADFGAAHDCATVAAGASCSIHVTFTPTEFFSPIPGTLTIDVQGEGILVRLSGVGEGTLTSHYFRSILQREPDAGGKAFWNGEASRVFNLGADPIETWFALAMSFFGSAEYAALNRDNSGFVNDLYKTFYNRTPDTAGGDYWVGQLQSGMPREVALAAFMFSTEFADFIKKHYGSPAIRAEIRMVFDFYRGLLGRLPDSDGFAYWVARFRQAQCQGGDTVRVVADQISGEFARGAESAARGRANAQYVGDLYNAFLRRGGDLAGVQFWMGQLDSGAQTRERLRGQFVVSPEFSARVSAVASQGCMQ